MVAHRSVSNGGSLPFTLRQHWLGAADRAPPRAAVTVARIDDTLVVRADLFDDDPFNRAREDNSRTWELGDVLEVFFARSDDRGYGEIHVTPDNVRLHLRFRDEHHHREITDLREVAADPELIRSAAWLTPRGWAAEVALPPSVRAGDRLRLSICRYDWTRGVAEPVLSSSSPHPVLAFHRPHEWEEIVVGSD